MSSHPVMSNVVALGLPFDLPGAVLPVRATSLVLSIDLMTGAAKTRNKQRKSKGSW
jgi:hypothetical protein